MSAALRSTWQRAGRARRRRRDARQVCTRCARRRIDGFVVQPMVERPHRVELIVGAAEDPVFGPVLLFGQGGVAVEVIDDRALALPPLNWCWRATCSAARGSSRCCAAIAIARRPRATRLREALVRVSQLAADLAEIAELDINPLLADADGVIALDARIACASRRVGGSRAGLRSGPIRGSSRSEIGRRRAALLADPAGGRAALLSVSPPSDAGGRAPAFFTPMRELPRVAARLTQIDYDREMAFLVDRWRRSRRASGAWAADPGFRAGRVRADRCLRSATQELWRNAAAPCPRLCPRARREARAGPCSSRRIRRMIELSKRSGFAAESGRAGNADGTTW